MKDLKYIFIGLCIGLNVGYFAGDHTGVNAKYKDQYEAIAEKAIKQTEEANAQNEICQKNLEELLR